jgi:amidohydrolase
VAYRSQVPGVMHACGHDCHMAMAIGVAQVLKQLDMKLHGSVRFIFQPSEEAAPSGAVEMVKAGVMEGVEAVVAYHVYPDIPAGQIGLRPGALTANCNEFKLSIHGRSGHAARPHLAIDAIRLSNQVLCDLYEIVGGRKNNHTPAILSVGKMSGGSASNIIADCVEIRGTVRTVEEESRREILSAIAERTKARTGAAGGAFKLEFPSPLDSVRNDPAWIELAREVAVSNFGEKAIYDIPQVSMGGEDFSCYLSKAPGALIRLGARKNGEEIRHLHTNHFDIDESALPFGVALMAMMILRYLGQQ